MLDFLNRSTATTIQHQSAPPPPRRYGDSDVGFEYHLSANFLELHFDWAIVAFIDLCFGQIRFNSRGEVCAS